MGESHLPTPEAASYELALANRKLVTVVMGMTLLMGLVACLAYLAGRSVTGIRAEQASLSAPPPPVIVERQVAAAPSVPAAPVAAKVAAPAAAPVVTQAAAAAPGGTRLYLQVAAGAVADFQPMRTKLEQAGLPIEVILIDDKHRLLVGPVQSVAQKQELEARLVELGLQYFSRRL